MKNPIIGGQMSKTVGIYHQLEIDFTDKNVYAVDTSNWKKSFPMLILRCFLAARSCDVIIMMPNKNGIKFILPFFSFFKHIYKFRLAYPVVGGWLPKLLGAHKYLTRAIKAVDILFPETAALKSELKSFCQCPIEVMPVFSSRSPVSEGRIPDHFENPVTICTFSRVTKEKGIDDAVQAVEGANQLAGKQICRLDVYGPLDERYAAHYAELFEQKKAFVNYRGILKGDSLKTLSQYYMLIFPTFYHGEGFPITICESFMSGLPVLAYNWRFNHELICHEKTGYLVEVHDLSALTQRLFQAINNKEENYRMRINCYEKSKYYQPQKVMERLNQWITTAE
ncbi:MAG: glycosyltransferase [Oscillospiraceae bacterium]